MRAYEVREARGIDGIALNPARPQPEPGFGEVLIRVRAASLNYRDLLVAKGRYGAATKPSVVPLSDGAGEVVAVGGGVASVRPGDRVAGAFFPRWAAGPISAEVTKAALGGSVDGMLAEYVVLPETGVVAVPEHLTFEEAATLPCAAVTAWNAVVNIGQIHAGQTVLLLGTGGVSMFALQFARLHGATVIQTSGSEEKIERARALGADHTLNYRSVADWDAEVLKLTGGRGVDLVVEVGGPGTLQRSLRAVRVGGTVVMIGLVAGTGEVNPMPLVSRAIRLQGVYVGSRQDFAEMNGAIGAHALRPVIGNVFEFDRALDAYRHLAAGAHFGKVVVRL